MIKTLKSVDIYTIVSALPWLSALVTMYSAQPTVSNDCYGWTSIIDQWVLTNSNRGNQVKEARVSITIVCPSQDNIATNEEDYIDQILDIITQWIVDEWCSKITNWWPIKWLYCTESTPTPLLFTAWNRAYKIKDFIIWYESND